MKRLFLLVLFILLTCAVPVSAEICDDWNVLDKAIRDSNISRKAARQKIIELDGKLIDAYAGKTGNSAVSFPVKGYGHRSFSDRYGSDYKPAGYNFYDGNRHGGHPAHDLFIRDKRRDGLDSGTGKPAEIVAFADGVVIAVNPSWEHPSDIRGGKYIWIFNPESNRYYYYAHLAKILVSPGDIVKSGDMIALLGRTGKNAYPKRSPTHLHFMCLSFNDGRMTPYNTYRELMNAGTR
jgi:murein DD-endopeptidase MepM/ murein hydrolase activator NlpD